MNIFKKATHFYKEKYRETLEEQIPGSGIRYKIVTNIFTIIEVICALILDKFLGFFSRRYSNFIARRKFSPFIKEWILSLSKWLLVGPGLFVLILSFNLVAPLEDPLSLYVLYCFVKIPLVIIALVTLLMPTPRRELEDALFRYRLRRRKKVMIGSLQSFRTTFEFDYDRDPQSDLYYLVPESSFIFPILFYCMELPEGHVPRSSAPAYDVQVASEWPVEDDAVDESKELIEVIQPFFLNDAETEEMLRQCKTRLKAAFPAEAIDWFIELTEKEPSMEFEVEYLFFSKLLTGIYPIEGYDYPEGVTELLAKLNATVNPWIKRKKTEKMK